MKNIFQKTLLATAIAATSMAASATLVVDQDNTGASVKETWFVPVEDLRTALAITTGTVFGNGNNNQLTFTPSANSTANLVVTVSNSVFTALTGTNTYSLCEVDTTGAIVDNANLRTLVGTLNVNSVTFASAILESTKLYELCIDAGTTTGDSSDKSQGFGLTLTADQQAAGNDVTINFNYGNGVLNNDTKSILTYANGLKTAVTTSYNETIDAVYKDALSFGNGLSYTETMDTLVVTNSAAAYTTVVSATDAPSATTELDGFSISIAGLNQAAVSEVALDMGTGNTDIKLTKAADGTYGLTSSSIVVGGNTINTYVDGTTIIDATSMSVNVKSKPKSSFASTVDYGTKYAGAWNLNGLQAKVAYVPVGYETINPIIKIANESSIDGKVFIAAVGRNITDGTDVEVSRTLSDLIISGDSVGSLTNDKIVEALGLDADKQYQLSLDLLVTGPTNSVHVTAQYKDEAIAGRVAVPVLYNRGTTWTQ